MKKIIFISIDPLGTSRRLINQINTALKSNFMIEVIATKKEGISVFKDNRNVIINYITLHSKGGIRKFLEFNLKLFFILLAKKYDLLFCRGLWVFPGIIPITLLKKTKIIYDAHEYFAGLKHFKNRPLKRWIWLSIEKCTLKKADIQITVSELIADQYKNDYPKINKIYIIRNLPPKVNLQEEQHFSSAIPSIEKTVVYSGYLLPGRLLPDIIKAFSYIKTNSIKLLIIGEGILYDQLFQLRKNLNLENKIFFKPMVPNNEIIPLLSKADLGLSLLKNDSLNHSFALPNKFFEYIAAGIPVLTTNNVSQMNYIKEYKVGKYINASDPKIIADAITEIFSNEEKYRFWQKNCRKAARELNWQNEAQKLKNIYNEFI